MDMIQQYRIGIGISMIQSYLIGMVVSVWLYRSNPTIIANIPDAISRRLTSIRSSKEMFTTGHYQQATDKAGYGETLQ